MMNKKELRRAAKRRRNAFFLTAGRRKEDRYFLREIPMLWKSYEKVFFYFSFGTEVATDQLIRLAFQEGKKVFLPRIGADRTMRFHRILPDTRLVSHVFGMQEPPEDAPVYEADEQTLILVPGLAFDRTGHRLGYGGGYYDSYLKEHPEAKSVGICYSVQMSEDIPLEEHDQLVGLIMNGQETIEISIQE